MKRNKTRKPHSPRAVHYSNYGVMKDKQIFCSLEWTSVGWNQPENLPPEVHATECDKFYTFVKTKVTCKKCLKKMGSKND